MLVRSIWLFLLAYLSACCVKALRGVAHVAILSRLLLTGLSLVLIGPAQAAEPTPAIKPAIIEKDRIDALIQAVQRAPGLQFVRNGSAHDAAAAADHLRLKWEKAGDRIKTAEQFIVGIASKSSMTGTPYQVRWPDGRSELAEQFLRAELAKIDARARAGQSG